jgi:nicotinamide riboside kinase
MKIKMKLSKLQGDMGQFRQKSVVLEPIDVDVIVEIEEEYVEDGALTLEGVKRLRDKIQEKLTTTFDDLYPQPQEQDWDENLSNDW